MNVVLDSDFMIIAVSADYVAGCGTRSELIVGKSLLDVCAENCDELRRSLEAVLQTGEPQRTSTQVSKVSLTEGEEGGCGERHRNSLNIPVFVDGRLSHIIHHLEDTTEAAMRQRKVDEREKIHEELRSAVGSMREAERAKDEFIAVISHELRTPMTSILGWTRMLALGGLDEQTHREALEALERSTHAQARLIEDLLDESRIAAGKLRLELRPADLRKLVSEAVGMVRPAAAAKRIKISVASPDRDCSTLADPARLQQVIGNLLSNAVKFTPEEGTIDVRVVADDTSAIVEVSDSGRGIDPSLLPHIFDRFRQGSSSGERQDGLGLGLAITRHLVEMHGGTVHATSDGQGSGSTFTIRLPLCEPGVSDEFLGRDASSRSSSLPQLDQLRILIVEDELDNRNVLAKSLKRCGAEVECSATAAGAHELIRSWSPDVLICDISLPDCDGCTFLEEVRSRGFEVPALALTVLGRPQEQARIVAAGFEVFRQKPIDPVDLAHEVARLARGEKRDASATATGLPAISSENG